MSVAFLLFSPTGQKPVPFFYVKKKAENQLSTASPPIVLLQNWDVSILLYESFFTSEWNNGQLAEWLVFSIILNAHTAF